MAKTSRRQGRALSFAERRRQISKDFLERAKRETRAGSWPKIRDWVDFSNYLLAVYTAPLDENFLDALGMVSWEDWSAGLVPGRVPVARALRGLPSINDAMSVFLDSRGFEPGEEYFDNIAGVATSKSNYSLNAAVAVSLFTRMQQPSAAKRQSFGIWGAAAEAIRQRGALRENPDEEARRDHAQRVAQLVLTHLSNELYGGTRFPSVADLRRLKLDSVAIFSKLPKSLIRGFGQDSESGMLHEAEVYVSRYNVRAQAEAIFILSEGSEGRPATSEELATYALDAHIEAKTRDNIVNPAYGESSLRLLLHPLADVRAFPLRSARMVAHKTGKARWRRIL